MKFISLCIIILGVVFLCLTSRMLCLYTLVIPLYCVRLRIVLSYTRVGFSKGLRIYLTKVSHKSVLKNITSDPSNLSSLSFMKHTTFRCLDRKIYSNKYVCIKMYAHMTQHCVKSSINLKSLSNKFFTFCSFLANKKIQK